MERLQEYGLLRFMLQNPPEKLEDWLALYYETCLYEVVVENILKDLGWTATKIQLFKEKTKEEARRKFFEEKIKQEEIIEEY